MIRGGERVCGELSEEVKDDRQSKSFKIRLKTSQGDKIQLTWNNRTLLSVVATHSTGTAGLG